MQKNMFFNKIALVLFLFIVVGCADDSILGKYTRENSSDEFIYLKKDGTFIIRYGDHKKIKTGTFGVEEDALALLTKEEFIAGDIKEGRIVLSDGTVWIKIRE